MLRRAPALLLTAALTACAGCSAAPASCTADGYPASAQRPEACAPGPGWLAWAFIKEGTSNPVLFIGKVDGTCQQRVTTDGAFYGGPAFFPGGRRLAYSSTRSGVNQLYLLDLETGVETPLFTVSPFTTPPAPPEPLVAAAPAVSPDGATVAFEGSLLAQPATSELFTVPAAGGDVLRITTSPTSTLPKWSPDGTTLYYQSYGTAGAELFSSSADGSGRTQLTTGSSLSSKFDITGDGRALVYARFSSTGTGSVPTELVSFELASGAIRVISSANEADPAVDAATSQVAVSRRTPSGYDLYLLDYATGAVKKQLTACPGQAFAATFAR
jgi:Tol biopolymer transport system component